MQHCRCAPGAEQRTASLSPLAVLVLMLPGAHCWSRHREPHVLFLTAPSRIVLSICVGRNKEMERSEDSKRGTEGVSKGLPHPYFKREQIHLRSESIQELKREYISSYLLRRSLNRREAKRGHSGTFSFPPPSLGLPLRGALTRRCRSRTGTAAAPCSAPTEAALRRAATAAASLQEASAGRRPTSRTAEEERSQASGCGARSW